MAGPAMGLMPIGQALAWAQASGLDRLDAQLLLLHAQHVPPDDQGSRRAWLLAHGDDLLDAEVLARFRHVVAQRGEGLPLAYIVGHKEFHGLLLAVDARVLVPRPDTEVLVDWALEVLAVSLPTGAAADPAVLELGTGSGAVALAIKHARPDLAVHAVDASADALEVAMANACRLQLTVTFLSGSWYGPVQGRYRCIVSNPPYIDAQDPHLPALRHEPAQALVSGAGGLADIRTIALGAPAHLQPGGWLIVEHGYQQGPSVRAIFQEAGLGNLQTRRDLAGHERCTGGRVIASGGGPLMK